MRRSISLVVLTGLLSFSFATQAETSELNENIYLAPTYYAKSPAKIFTLEYGEIEIPEGGVLTVIETLKTETGEELVRLGLDIEGAHPMSMISDFWIPVNELATPALMLMAEIAARMTYCYRYVKLYLLKKGLVNSYLPGSSAWMAKDVLPKHGFRRTGRAPRNSRTLDVCVYYGGRGNNGHIEVLDPKGWYYGYGYFKSPISGRSLISCFSK